LRRKRPEENPDTQTGDDDLNQDQSQNKTQLNLEKEPEVLVRELLHQEAAVPLFLRDSSDGQKGDAQDEKDKTEE